jgi:hypothetical protein
MNKFEAALERIKKNVEIQDNWTEEDIEHYKTVVEALEKRIPKKPDYYGDGYDENGNLIYDYQLYEIKKAR